MIQLDIIYTKGEIIMDILIIIIGTIIPIAMIIDIFI